MSALDIKLAKQAQSALAVAVEICRCVPATAHERILPEYAVPAMKSIGRLVNWQSETVHGFEDIHQANQALIKAIFEAELVSGATPASPANLTELNAMRWLFTMEQQEAQGEKPQAFMAMFRKVRDENRSTPTRAEYEAATDAAMVETGFMPASAQPVSQHTWRVGEFWSSSCPGNIVLMLARSAAEIACHEEHKSFIRWIDSAAPEPVSQPVVAGREVLKNLLRFAEKHVCYHTETRRAGTIWEICDQCGSRWADDEGGRPAESTPPAVEAARALLAATPAPATEPVVEVPEGWMPVPDLLIERNEKTGEIDIDMRIDGKIIHMATFKEADLRYGVADSAIRRKLRALATPLATPVEQGKQEASDFPVQVKNVYDYLVARGEYPMATALLDFLIESAGPAGQNGEAAP